MHGPRNRSSTRTAALVGVATCLGVAGTATVARAQEPKSAQTYESLSASIGGVGVPRGIEDGIAVEMDRTRMDAAAIRLAGKKGKRLADGVRPGDDVLVDARSGPARESVFKGEVVAIEPVYEAGGDSQVILRAFNRLHRLTRGRKSRTFENATDADIVAAVAQENGLLSMSPTELQQRYDHVYQHNQTDLEFLLERAARIDYEVFVDDTTLVFQKPRESEPVVLSPRRADGDARLRTFHPRLSSSQTVQEVTVRGYDPNSGRAISGTAAAPAILLVPQVNDPGLVLGARITVETDVPVASSEEAAAIARSILDRRLSSLLSAEAASDGNPRLRAGAVVSIEGAGRHFDGKYYVVGVSHRFGGSHGDGGGYRTLLRLRRADGALFFLPEIDDEVLVAFEHGDIERPVIVGTLWGDCDFCDDDRHR